MLGLSLLTSLILDSFDAIGVFTDARSSDDQISVKPTDVMSVNDLFVVVQVVNVEFIVIQYVKLWFN